MRTTCRFFGLGLLVAGLAGPASGRQDPIAAGPDEPDGVQVLTQGPIHEAFAQPVLFDPLARPGRAPDAAAPDPGGPPRPDAPGGQCPVAPRLLDLGRPEE